MIDINNKIIICPKVFQKVFLSLKNRDPFLNITIFDLTELQKHLFGEYNVDTIQSLLENTSYSLKMIRKSLNYIQRGINVDANRDIQAINDLINKNKLIETDDLIKELFKQYAVMIVGYSENNVELNNLLKVLNPLTVTYNHIDEFIECSDNKLYKFQTIDDEARYVVNTIINRNICELKNVGKIKRKVIVCDVNEYETYLKAFEKAYNIKFYLKNNKSLINTALCKGLLSNVINGGDPLAYLNNIDNESIETISFIRNIIETYLVKKDKSGYVNDVYNSLVILLSECNIEQPHYENEIIVTSALEFDSETDYYVLGASDSFIPALVKNNSFIDDSILVKNNINSSTIENAENEEISKLFLMFKSVQHISYYCTKGKEKVYPTNLINENKIITPKMLDFDYSIANTKAYYSKALEIRRKYNENTYDLSYGAALKEKENEIKLFDSSFGGINQLKSDRHLSFSYSSIESLYECPFKYYCGHILNISSFEETFASKLGTIVHAIFERIIDNDFYKSFNEVVKEKTQELGLTVEDLFLLESNKEKIKYGYDNIRSKIFTKDLSNIEHEYRRTYLVDDHDKGLSINGSIDNFVTLYPSNDVVILDYKTGSYINGDDKLYENGIGLQLLMYSYLLSKDPKYKNLAITGVYYCPVISKDRNPDSKKFKDTYRFDGITFKDGFADAKSFTNKASKVSGKTMKDYRILVEKKVKDACDIVRRSKFTISPYNEGNKVKPCNFCEFANICFRNRAIENKYHNDNEEEDIQDGDE